MKRKIAILADIHGNQSALRAVLQDIDGQEQVEHIYCLGDLIGIGYETNDVLELLSARSDISFVMGNHDEAILDILAGREPYSRKSERKHHEWIAARLDRGFIPFLEKIPIQTSASYNGQRLLFTHYHLNDQGNFISVDYEPTEKKLDEHYYAADADLVCFGHHHVIHYFKSRKRLYFNPGSLGCSFEPLAPYALMEFGGQGEVHVSMREVPYDNREFLLGYHKLAVPDADYILKIFHGDQQLKYK